MPIQRIAKQTNKLLENPVTKSPATAIFFVLFFPLLIEHAYSDFVRGSELNSRLGWFILILAAIWLIRYKFFPFLLLGVLLISGCMDNLYAITFGGVFTTASFEAMTLTDSHEAIGFFQAYASFENLSLLGIYITGSLYLISKSEISTTKSRHHNTVIILGLILAGVATYRLGFLHKYYDTIPGFAGTLLSYFSGYSSVAKEIEMRRKLVENTPITAILNQSNEKQTYLIIIGESLSRNHMGLYGYHRNTTPELSKLSDELIVYTDVISTHAQTQPSLRHALTHISTENKMPVNKALSLVDIANKAGFKTWWISNQQPLRSTLSAIANMADETQYISNDYHGVQVRRFDGLMQPYVENALNDNAQKKVIFVHLMGSHLQYKNRYPEKFTQFSDTPEKAYRTDLSTRQIDYINSYDNSVLYTDNVVANMINALKKTSNNKISASVFLADHGEEVFDSKDFVGHGPDSVTPDMVEIPYVVWTSKKYREVRQNQINNMQTNINQPFSLADNFHFTSSLIGIESDIIDRSKSLLTDNYTSKKRQVYGVDYELKTNN